jgi:hypothetical protein
LESHKPLRTAYAAWLNQNQLDMAALESAHAVAAIAAHRHYVASIPVYRRLAESLRLVDCEDADVIYAELASTDDLFKSYSSTWLDDRDFGAMTRWLREIYAGPIEIDLSAVSSIESWLTALAAIGVHVKYSSGTSGQFSFIPRDRATEDNLIQAGMAQVFSMLVTNRIAVAECDAFLFAFRGGNQGFATIAEKLGALTARQEFLFDFPIDADLIRAVIRQTATADQLRRFEKFRADVVEHSAVHYDRMLESMRATASSGRRALIWGPPFQLLDACRRLESRGARLAMPDQSWVIFGGGWKSFAGERVARQELLGMLADRLGVPAQRVLEGYGMSECNVLSLRCGSGRFHIPPLIWPMVMDEALYPLDRPGRGRYAFADPFAVSYPGFLISGDSVELSDSPCDCGKPGWSIVGEVERAAGAEVRGCGGVMASVRA